MRSDFLPTQKADVKGGGQVDFVIVSGDAYVDHPSFGTAIIGRYLQRLGHSVGIIAQPDWHSKQDFMRFGRPKLAFLVAAGNVDSMVNHYTASKKRRSEDFYSPGMKAGRRPDRATIVYCNRVREAFSNAPIVIAGVEASLRRFAHYDYWDDKVRRSILVDSGADMLIYGMAEHAVKAIAQRLADGERIGALDGIAGTCYLRPNLPEGATEVASFEEVTADKKAYAKAFAAQYVHHDPIRGKKVAQKHGDSYLIAEKPAMPLNRAEMDDLATLKYMRTWHPDYDDDGGVPAITEVKFSIAANRGCYGECAFCALAFHQGRIVQSRSTESIVKEAELLSKLPDFKGYIHDVGGPTANFTKPACPNQLKNGACAGKRCLAPTPCKNLVVDHSEYVNTLRAVRKIPKIKKVFVRSGVRFDYIMLDKSKTFLKELSEHHISGQLKVAPEHVSPGVLKLMGKPDCSVFTAFKGEYENINKKMGKNQYLVPYFISGHPGSTLKDAIALAEYMRDNRIRPEQVQDFYPTPGTRATCMYYSGIDPMTMKTVYVPKDYEEKRLQRALLQYHRKENHALVRKALDSAGRGDLIGFGGKCLVPPQSGIRNFRKSTGKPNTAASKNERAKTDRRSAKGGQSRDGQGQRTGNGRTDASSKSRRKSSDNKKRR